MVQPLPAGFVGTSLPSVAQFSLRKAGFEPATVSFWTDALPNELLQPMSLWNPGMEHDATTVFCRHTAPPERYRSNACF